MSNYFSESIFKETPQKEEVVEKKREPVKEDFTYKNIVSLCGKIIKIYPSGKDGMIFVLSCGHGKKQKQNKDGLILRNTIPVCFFDKEAKAYTEKYHVGDFVTVNAVAQTIIKNRNDNKTAIWGLAMGPKYYKNRKPIPDCNIAIIRGKIDRVKVLSPSYMIVNVYTYTEKTRPNVTPNSEYPKLKAMYKSITPIGVRCPDRNAHELAKKCTPGTWVNCKGYVDDRNMGGGYKKTHVMAVFVDIIGQIQEPREENTK